MKNFKIITLVLATLLSCSSENHPKQDSIIGQWQLIEIEGGFPTQSEMVENGYIYAFKNDGSFTSNKYQECGSGNYSFTETTLTLIYDCIGFTASIEYPPGTFVENYIFQNGKLILRPTYLNCIEGCAYKFKKIADE
jgi:hypothetical protein